MLKNVKILGFRKWRKCIWALNASLHIILIYWCSFVIDHLRFDGSSLGLSTDYSRFMHKAISRRLIQEKFQEKASVLIRVSILNRCLLRRSLAPTFLALPVHYTSGIKGKFLSNHLFSMSFPAFIITNRLSKNISVETSFPYY